MAIYNCFYVFDPLDYHKIKISIYQIDNEKSYQNLTKVKVNYGDIVFVFNEFAYFKSYGLNEFKHIKIYNLTQGITTHIISQDFNFFRKL